MKKYFMVFAALFTVSAASAQMADMMGTLAIDGMLTTDAYQGVGQMRQALGRVQMQQDLAMLNLEIQNRFMHSYKGLNKEILNFKGLRGINWDVAAVSDSEYFVELADIDAETCLFFHGGGFGARRTEFVSGGCQPSGNKVRIYF